MIVATTSTNSSMMPQDVKDAIDSLLALRDKYLIENYAYGIIYQPFQTEFCFMDGTQGYGSPYVPNDNMVTLVKRPSYLWERAYRVGW